MTLARLLDGFNLVAHGVLSYCDHSSNEVEVADSAPGGYPLSHPRVFVVWGEVGDQKSERWSDFLQGTQPGSAGDGAS